MLPSEPVNLKRRSALNLFRLFGSVAVKGSEVEVERGMLPSSLLKRERFGERLGRPIRSAREPGLEDGVIWITKNLNNFRSQN